MVRGTVIASLVLMSVLLPTGATISAQSSDPPDPAQAAAPTEIRVVPDDYESITAALDGIPTGATVQVRAGVYDESVDISTDGVTLGPFGDGQVWIDGECTRSYGINVLGASDVTIRGIGVRQTLGPSIRTQDQVKQQRLVTRLTVDGNTLQDFNCDDSTSAQNQAGVAIWYGGPGQRIVNNTITRRVDLPGNQRGFGDGIWFKSDNKRPSGGGHVIADNTITGGYDGIGGEVERTEHGSFDQDTLIARNNVSNCFDDGIQVEGGDVNVRVEDNSVSECGVGIAFAPNLVGPLTIERNTITSSSPRGDPAASNPDALACFKVGHGGRGTAYLTDNVCHLNFPGDPASPGSRRGDGIKRTNPGLSAIVTRGNVFDVSRYVFEFVGTPMEGSSFDGDCLYTSDPSRFISMRNDHRFNFAQFQSMGYEQSGRTGPC